MIRASNLYRLSVCPGSHRLETEVGEDASKDSVQAAEGRLLHGYSQNPKLDRSFLKPHQRDLLKIAQDCRDQVMGLAFAYLGLTKERPGDWEYGRETLLWEEAIPGHCDVWALNRDLEAVVIVDEKYGWKVVTPATGNLQLRCYAVGAHYRWEPKTIIVAIVQPRLSYAERITMAVYTEDDIQEAEDELKAIVVNALKKDAPLVPGEEQCRYCTAKLICPAFQKIVGQGQQLIQVNGTLTKRTADAEALLKGCSNEQLEQILQAISFSDFIKEGARDEARSRLAIHADALPNYALGKAGNIRKVADVRRAVSLLALRGDISTEEALECCDLYLSPLQDKLREKTKCTFKEAAEKLNETLAPVIEFQEKKPTLTRKR